METGETSTEPNDTLKTKIWRFVKKYFYNGKFIHSNLKMVKFVKKYFYNGKFLGQLKNGLNSSKSISTTVSLHVST
jgi:hypothetical protein